MKKKKPFTFLIKLQDFLLFFKRNTTTTQKNSPFDDDLSFLECRYKFLFSSSYYYFLFCSCNNSFIIIVQSGASWLAKCSFALFNISEELTFLLLYKVIIFVSLLDPIIKPVNENKSKKVRKTMIFKNRDLKNKTRFHFFFHFQLQLQLCIVIIFFILCICLVLNNSKNSIMHHHHPTSVMLRYEFGANITYTRKSLKKLLNKRI